MHVYSVCTHSHIPFQHHGSDLKVNGFDRIQNKHSHRHSFCPFLVVSLCLFTLSAALFIKALKSIQPHSCWCSCFIWVTTDYHYKGCNTEGTFLYTLCKNWKQFSVCRSVNVPLFLSLSLHWDSHLSSPFPLKDTHTHTHCHLQLGSRETP